MKALPPAHIVLAQLCSMVTMMLKLLTASLKIGLSIRCSKSLASLIIMATYEYETLTRVTHNIRMYSSMMTVVEISSVAYEIP